MAHLQRPRPRERQRQPLTQEAQRTFTVSPQPCPAPSPARSAPSWTSRKVTRGRGGSLRDQLADSEQHIGRLQDNLRHEREKAQRLQTRCTQQAVDLRRSEQQSNRLKERLAKLADGHRGRRPSIDILNALASAPGKETPSGMRSLGRREEEVLRVMLERREAELREDVQLRQCLTTLLCSLRADMERTLQDCVVAGGQGLDCKRLIQSEAALGDHVTGGVVQGWSKVQKRLADFISDGFSSVTMGTDQDKLLAQLETDLEQSEQLVRLQQQLLQDNVGAPLPPSLADSYYLEEWERLQAKWAEFESQRRSFQRERQAFTEAAIRLGHEFQQQKALLLRQQFLCHSPLLPPTHGRRDRSSLSIPGADRLTLSSCQPDSPSSLESGITPWGGQSGAQTPSTPELYSALRIPFYRRISMDSPSQGDGWEGRAERVLNPAPALDWSF
ncbi:afadin- and alpha-actinin-binding protein B isoform X2 [Conger conger]|uniref:afadin- and alpha-actinin-binding protein B isoform X2 n=1 Tax=Conger conger TaxID=82655 RepID=UPI002A5AEB11|nr:afadin- and alpha-actinin-binding protein B isoform X2 [Conger conger]